MLALLRSPLLYPALMPEAPSLRMGWSSPWWFTRHATEEAGSIFEFRRNFGMESGRCSRQRGQVLLMVTLALIPLFGMLGLVTDIGYMQFVKMSAQTAAEAAAQAAIISYHETVGGSNAVCGIGGVVC